MGIYSDFFREISKFKENFFSAINKIKIVTYRSLKVITDVINVGDFQPEKPCVAGSIPALSTSKPVNSGLFCFGVIPMFHRFNGVYPA